MGHRVASASSPLLALLLAGLAMLAAPAVRATSASDVNVDVDVDADFAQEVQHDFKMGLFPRQAASPLNLQTFAGAVGGIGAAAILQSADPERPFEVDGDTFPDALSAVNRACDNQFQKCQLEANSNSGTASFAVGDCDVQNIDCKAAGITGTPSSFPALVSSNAEFDFFCEE